MNRHERRALAALMRAAEQMTRRERESGDAVPESPCGHCGVLLDGASSDTGVKAKPGDISVCAACAGLNRFRPDMTLQAMSLDEVIALPGVDAETIAAYRGLLSRGKPS